MAIDYTKGQINISQVLTDFRSTILAINAPDDVRDEVNLYLGLVEKEHLASIYCRETNVELYLAINPAKAKEMGFNVVAHEEKKFALLPSKVIVSTEEAFENALKLVKFFVKAFYSEIRTV